jgi:hypothetical protein
VKACILDTGPLVLWFVGNIDASKVGHQRKLEAYSMVDFNNLEGILNGFQYHITLPNILTEASNHIGAGNQTICEGAAEALARYAAKYSEEYVHSSGAVSNPKYLRLGLTDTAISMVALKGATVITVDHALFGQLTSDGIHAINLIHYRTPSRYRS